MILPAYLLLDFNFPTANHNSCSLLHGYMYLKYFGTPSETVIKILHIVQVDVGEKGKCLKRESSACK